MNFFQKDFCIRQIKTRQIKIRQMEMRHYNIKGSKQAVQFVHERIFIRQIEIRQIESRQIKIRQIVLRHEHDDMIRLFSLTLKRFLVKTN